MPNSTTKAINVATPVANIDNKAQEKRYTGQDSAYFGTLKAGYAAAVGCKKQWRENRIITDHARSGVPIARASYILNLFRHLIEVSGC
ncbi:unnamed protein product, partial [Orchesella dallaii]